MVYILIELQIIIITAKTAVRLITTGITPTILFVGKKVTHGLQW